MAELQLERFYSSSGTSAVFSPTHILLDRAFCSHNKTRNAVCVTRDKLKPWWKVQGHEEGRTEMTTRIKMRKDTITQITTLQRYNITRKLLDFNSTWKQSDKLYVCCHDFNWNTREKKELTVCTCSVHPSATLVFIHCK
jgi:hypothetical protein